MLAPHMVHIRHSFASSTSSSSSSSSSSSTTYRVDATRVEIVRASIRLPSDASKVKPSNDNVIFVIKVHTASGYHLVEQSWTAFTQLKEALLLALDPGHACSGVCPWLWEDLYHNFEHPTQKVNLRTWLQMRLHRHTKRTVQVYLEHFQELLDSMLHLLRQRDVQCHQFHDVCDVLTQFLQVPSMLDTCASSSRLRF
ncbi:hypothetical protein SDRG_12372 [Saprolegnia diclina VS20]|uniref:PX domain-containing protein n=1 Tax=Saprolegnia diclina (strain VS20) TaxID=1156394 RepID=T0Q5E3_SAPDV|nr:hypothetical protein SDRG_12372 [Saprolegnia diclina VS20]EQC29826.1 hypothetical protein SDRG_12372 [Saprolegnia diclina VS20]|eukprot:XP_008616665.1 hypothetical protein SDRG_12372 [Saprolegnia diclina VS20]